MQRITAFLFLFDQGLPRFLKHNDRTVPKSATEAIIVTAIVNGSGKAPLKGENTTK